MKELEFILQLDSITKICATIVACVLIWAFVKIFTS